MSRRILIVEDNQHNLELFKDILELNGYVVLIAEDGFEGVRLAKEERPDLILMDIQLPGIDGITATKEIKSDVSTINIPIVALTAFAMKGDDERFKSIGFNGYIPKPVRINEFIAAINNFFL